MARTATTQQRTETTETKKTAFNETITDNNGFNKKADNKKIFR